jgi:hypothetical protein
MFEKLGFKAVGPYGLSNVVVRRTVAGGKAGGREVKGDAR